MKNNIAYISARGNSYMFSRNVTGTVAFRMPDTLDALPSLDITVRQVKNFIDPCWISVIVIMPRSILTISIANRPYNSKIGR